MKETVFIWVMPSAINFALAVFTLAVLLWQLWGQRKERYEMARARRLLEAFEQGVVAIAAERAATKAMSEDGKDAGR